MKVEIEFVSDIVGHDIETIEQMYKDWSKSSHKVIAPIIWEKRYSETEKSDRLNRWMRIGRINGMTVAIVTKHEVKGKPTRYMVRLPNNGSLESIQNEIITLSISEAMMEAEKYIAKYVSNLSV